MSIDTPSNVTELITAVPSRSDTAEPLPLVDPAKAAKLRALIQGRAAAERAAEQLRAELDRLRHAPVPADDPRVRHIWIAAARVAEDEDYCSQYDRIVELAGGPTRDELRDAGDLDRSYRVRTLVTVEVWLNIDAASEDRAIRAIDHLDTSELRDKLQGVGLDDVDLEEWDAREAEEDD